MKPALLFPLCAAAGLAGWLGMSCLSETETTAGTKKPTASSAPPAMAATESEAAVLQRYAAPAQSSTRLAELAARLASAPFSELKRLLAAVEKWPSGVPRDMARSLLQSRLWPELADAPGPVVEKQPPLYETLALALAAGQEGEDWSARLGDWAKLDPAAARAAVLQMPSGALRTEAVDRVAEALRHDDPAGALRFVLEAGEPYPGSGAALAWLALIRQDGEAAETVAGKLSAMQSDSLATALADLVKDAGTVPEASLEPLLHQVRTMPESAGRTALMEEMFRRQPMVIFDDTPDSDLKPETRPEHALVVAAMLERLARESPDKVFSSLLAGMGNLTKEGDAAVLNTAAPSLLPQLARSGHVAEAVQLLQKVEDRRAWNTAFQHLLPYWMETDPAAARAALESAPLTTLEREKWEQHPALLLPR